MRWGRSHAGRRLGHALLTVALTGCTAMCGEGKEPPGDPRNLDPIAVYDEARSYAGFDDLKLRQLSAKGVRSDGTIDLEAESYRPSADYHWVRPTDPPPDAPPVGAGGGEHWHQTVAVSLRRPGDTTHETDEHGTRQVISKGMMKTVSDPESGEIDDKNILPAPPRCTFADLWKVAKEHGAPSGAVAHIDYLNGKYNFRISDTDVHLDFDPDCGLIED